jgi:hypothetical protein
MLTPDQTLVSNRTGYTLPGAAGSTVFSQITGTTGSTVDRRVAATANTTPEVMTISHEIRNVGFKQRIRSLLRFKRTYSNVDPSTTGNVVPSFSWGLTLDRPTSSGGAVTVQHLKDSLGQLIDAMLISGQLDKFLNQEA